MDSALVTLLSSAGVAGVFCIMFAMGLIYPKSVVDDLRRERDFERQRADQERDRANVAEVAAQATRDVLSEVLHAGRAVAGRSSPAALPDAERGPT